MSVAVRKSFFESLIASCKPEDRDNVPRNGNQVKQNEDICNKQDEEEKENHNEIRQSVIEKEEYLEIGSTHVPNQGVARADNIPASDTDSRTKSHPLRPASLGKEQLNVIIEDKVLADTEENFEDDDITQVEPTADTAIRSEDENTDSDGQLQDQFRSLLQIDSGLSASESLGSRSSSKLSLQSSSEETTAFMVDAYKNVIKHHFKVTEILPYLPLIDKRRADMIKSKHDFCASDAVELLIETLKDTKADGIWQSFLDALDKLEHTHLRKLLSNETETHYSYKSEILRLVSPEIQQRICFPDFLDVVYEKELVTETEKEEVDIMLKSKGTVPAAGLLLEKVDKHKTDWDKLFVDVLEHFFMADIAKVFKMVEDNEETKIPAETTFIQPKKSRKREKFRKRRSEPVHNTHNTEDENKDNEICTGTERGLFENPAQQVDERLEVTRLFNVVIGIHTDLNAGLNRISQRLEEVCTAVGNLEEKFINRTYSKCEHSCQGGNEINNTSEK